MGQNSATGENVDTFRADVVELVRRDNRKEYFAFFVERISEMDLAEEQVDVRLWYLLNSFPKLPNSEM